jgi:hypothetical protein
MKKVKAKELKKDLRSEIQENKIRAWVSWGLIVLTCVYVAVGR